jgi:fucose permease
MNSPTTRVRLGPRGTMLSTCLCFFALGMALSALGPTLPELATRSGSQLASLGGLFSAIFLGALIAQLAAGPLGDRFDQRAILLAGIALFALGTLGYLVSHTLPLMLVCAAIAGLGQGALVIGNNMLIARVFAGRSTAALNLSNVFFGAGDVAGPAIAGLALHVCGAATPALWFSVALILLSAALVPFVPTTQRQPFSNERAAGHTPIYRTPMLWALSALVLLYVGNEISLSGWTATYIQRTTTLDAAMAALVTAGFWLGVTVGRVIGALLGARLAANQLLELCLSGAVLGGLLLAASVGHAPLTIAATLWLGLCFGPVYPTAIALLADSFREQPGTAISIVSALGSLGGMLLPWLQGNLLASGGPPASALLIAAGTLAMLALHAGRRLIGMVADRPGERL